MPLIEPIFGLRLVFVFGVINIIALLLIFFSCRCMVGIKFIQKMQRYRWYNRFYRWHCYYWWLLFISVILHSIIAFLLLGNPL